MLEAEVAHGPGCGADVERVAGVDEDNAQLVEISGSEQGEIVFRSTFRKRGCAEEACFARESQMKSVFLQVAALMSEKLEGQQNLRVS